MPRNRNNNNNNNNGGLILLDEYHLDLDHPREPIRPVKDFLKNNYWDMLKAKGDKIECSICLSDIDCKNCFSLMNCGHSFHLCCIIKCNNCPLCRN